jgi:replicative DNA helicase
MSMPEGFRQPPFDIDSEQRLLGSILISNDGYRLISHVLRPEHFYEPVHRRIYGKICQMIEAGQLADNVTIRFAFQSDPDIPSFDGDHYFTRLAQSSWTALNIPDYASHIIDLAVRRRIIQAAEAAANRAYDPSSEAGDEQLAALERDLEFIRDGGGQGRLDIIDAAGLDGLQTKPREWLIEDWLPLGAITSYYGPGGVGKSLTALQAAIAISMGLPFFGIRTVRAPVLGIFCEDDADELHRRLVSCCKSMSVDIGSLDNLHWSARCGEGFDGGSAGNLIARVDTATGILVKMPLYGQIKQAALDLGAKLVILDNISHIFGGNENDRADVTQFLNLLNDLARAIGGAVLLIGHTAKAEGSEYSGCTAWNNDIRSRWLIQKPSQTDDDDSDPLNGARILSKLKANYSTEEEIIVVWDDGAFKRDMHDPGNFVDTIERRHREKKAEDAFLACLDKLTEQGRNVSHSERSISNYAPKIMMRMGEADGLLLRDLRLAMERLFDKEAIEANAPVGKGKNRSSLKGLARKGCTLDA